MTKSEIKQLDDISLVETLCSTKNTDAYDEFLKRYYKVVKQECLLKCKQRKLDPHIGEEIANKTFEKVYKTKSFDRDKLKKGDVKVAITGWLYRIMLNQFYDYHKSVKKENEPTESYFDDLFEEFAKASDEELFDQREFALKVFEKLNKKEKEVILTDSEVKRGRKYLL